MVRLKAYSEGGDGAPRGLEQRLEPLRRIAQELQATASAPADLADTSEGADAEAPSNSAPRSIADPASWRVDGEQVHGLLREVERLRELHLRLDERVRELDLGIAALPRGKTSKAETVLANARRALAIDGEESAALV